MKKPAEIIHPVPFENDADSQGRLDQRRWEFDFKNEIIVTNKTPVDVLFIGDSITNICELNAYYRKFGFIVNRGISGDTAQVLARRFMADAVQINPKLTVMLIGINNTWIINEAEDAEKAAEDCYKIIITSYTDILEKVKEYGMKLIFCSILPIKGCHRLQKELIVRINAKIKELCSEYGCVYADLYPHMLAENGVDMSDEYSQDGCHPNAIGFNKMAELITPLIEKGL